MPEQSAKRPGGRPRTGTHRTIAVQIFFTPDEWMEAQLIAAAHSYYQLTAFIRELLLREISKPDGARVLGEDVATRAAVETIALRAKREKRVKQNAARVARAARLSGQSAPKNSP